MFKNEIKSLLKNKFLIIAIVGVITIPMIYTNLFLRSMWDPYGKIEDLPVAIVNLDKSAFLNGEKISIGDDMVKTLKDEKSLKFDFVSEEKAQKGLSENDYYMTVTIPNDFSKNATTVLEENPKKMVLEYKTNPAKNYIASKLSETAFLKMKDAVSQTVTEVYTKALLENIDKISNGLTDAHDGVKLLSDGSSQLVSGNQTLYDNLVNLKSSTLKFKDGVSEFSVGLNTYLDAVSVVNSSLDKVYNGTVLLSDNVSTLSNSTQKLNEGSNSFNSALNTYTNGVDTANNGALALKNGISKYIDGVNTVKQGSNLITQNNKNIVDGLNSYSQNFSKLIENNEKINSTVDTLSQGVSGVNQGLEQINSILNQSLQSDYNSIITMIENSSLSDSEKQNIKTAILQNVTTLKTIKAVSDKITPIQTNINNAFNSENGVKTAIKSYTDSTNSLNTAFKEKISSGVNLYLNSVQKLDDGINLLVQNNDNLINGSSSLSDGLNTLGQNSDNLKNGYSQIGTGISLMSQKTPNLINAVDTLSQGVGQINSGVNTLNQKNTDLKSALNTINESSAKLNDGSNQLADGALQLKDGTVKLNDGILTLSDGLKSSSDEIKSVHTGNANSNMMSAPIDEVHNEQTTVKNNGYAMAPYMMSVGLWVACIAFSIVYPLCSYDKRIKSAFKWWSSKAIVLLIITSTSAVLMVLSLKFFNGLNPQYLGRTLLIAILASLAFMSILYFFNAFLGKIGSFIMIIYMVIQLSGSAGTYPVEISGDFVSSIHKYLPFTYTVNAFRNTISGEQSITNSIIVLSIIIVVFSILTIILFRLKLNKINNNKLTVYDRLEEYSNLKYV